MAISFADNQQRPIFDLIFDERTVELGTGLAGIYSLAGTTTRGKKDEVGVKIQLVK